MELKIDISYWINAAERFDEDGHEDEIFDIAINNFLDNHYEINDLSIYDRIIFE